MKKLIKSLSEAEYVKNLRSICEAKKFKTASWVWGIIFLTGIIVGSIFMSDINSTPARSSDTPTLLWLVVIDLIFGFLFFKNWVNFHSEKNKIRKAIKKI